MKKLEYQISFTTPAFLGNAEQVGQWRTPPFKALLRQWWRIVYAPEVGFDVSALRRDEGKLFGVAADGDGSRRAQVRLRLTGGWGFGDYRQLEDCGRVCHPEVDNDKAGPACNGGPGRRIKAALYLGFGPVNTHGLARPPAIAPGPEHGNCLSIAVPEHHRDAIARAVELSAWFGTLGSRSRNGWGAIDIQPCADTKTPSIPPLSIQGLEGVLRPIDQCLQLDWPHAIGTDEGKPLVWQTRAGPSWRKAIEELARIKVALRTQPALSLDKVPKGSFSARHLLAYPVTHHPVNGDGWGNQGRLANQIRFKVNQQNGVWRGLIVHLPCRLPAEMLVALPRPLRQKLDQEALAIWKAVHQVLDVNAERIS